uniref:Protein bric-a-brac 2 n=1 Tax=Cacopsylla melanoneura TaxID=428564 RepID=A0A8D8SI68_9HEMI
MASITTGTNYCMKWQNFQVHLAFELYQLLKLESMVDVTLKADGEAFQAHKIILSASSPFFQEILSPIENDCHPIIILDEVPAVDVKAILEFIYFGEIKVEGANIFSVLKTAQSLKITALLEIENHIIQNPICTSTVSNEIEVTITTPQNKKAIHPKAKSPAKKQDKTKVLGQSSVPTKQVLGQSSVPKQVLGHSSLPLKQVLEQPSIPPKQVLGQQTQQRVVQTSLPSQLKLGQTTLPVKKPPTQPVVPALSTNLNYLNVSPPKTSLPTFSPCKSSSILPLKQTISNRPDLPLVPIVSPPKVSTKRSLSLLDPIPSKSNSLPSTSFTSIDPSLSLSNSLFTKSIYYSDSFDGVISKPLAELQPLETIENTEKFTHKDGSQFIALDGFSAGSLLNESSQKGDNNAESISKSNESSKNTEIHVVQFDGLEPMLDDDDDDDPLGPWLTLKPSTTNNEVKQSSKLAEPVDLPQQTEQNNQFVIVGPDGKETHCLVDEFFMTVDDDRDNCQSGPSSIQTTLSKEDMLNRAIDEIANTNKSITEIVNQYNIPRSTLYYRAKSSGIRVSDRDTYNEFMQTVDKAVNYVKGGATLREACDKYGVSKTVLWRKVNKTLGHKALTLRSQCKSKYSQSSLKMALSELRSGFNLAMVCKKYSIPFATLHRAQNRLIDLGLLTKEKGHMPRYEKDQIKQSKLLQAVRAVQEKHMTTSQAAIYYNVPKVTLWRKLSYLNKMMDDMDIEEIEMDSLDLVEEVEEGEEKDKFILPDHFKQDEEMMILMMEEESLQDEAEYTVLGEENISTPTLNNDKEAMLSGNAASASEQQQEEEEEEGFLFKSKTVEGDDLGTSFILVNEDMCLKID